MLSQSCSGFLLVVAVLFRSNHGSECAVSQPGLPAASQQSLTESGEAHTRRFTEAVGPETHAVPAENSLLPGRSNLPVSAELAHFIETFNS